jgi:hypothetical protein
MLQFTPAEALSWATVAVKDVDWPAWMLLLSVETPTVIGLTGMETEFEIAESLRDVPVTVAVQPAASGAGAV